MRREHRVPLFSKLCRGYRYRLAQKLQSQSRFAAAHRQLALSARAGHVDAQFRLADAYMRGTGCVRSGSEALRWYERAAMAGQRDAQFELGVALLTDHDTSWCAGPSANWVALSSGENSEAVAFVFPGGTSIEKDAERAAYWLEQSANAGKPEAQANLGWLLLKGIGSSVDRASAHHWLTLAAAHDISQAALGLAEYYGDSTKPEYCESERSAWLQKSADGGNASAAFQLGSDLLKKAQSQEEHQKAEYYLQLATDRKHVVAAYELGMLLIKSASTGSEVERGAEYLRSSAKAGHVPASMALGDLYCRGDKLKPDLREAAHWFKSAADRGDIQAQFQTGTFYARGEGVARDLAHAARYFELSARGGHLVGALNAGIFYERGYGVTKNMEQAVKWLHVAADGGLPQAQVRLAQLLNLANSGLQESEFATRLLEQAAAQDDPDAKFELAKILLAEGNTRDEARLDELLMNAISKRHLASAELVLTQSAGLQPSKTLRLAAIRLIEGAADNGSVLAMVVLARELQKGKSVALNVERAEFLLRKAAEREDATANFELGVLYCRRNRYPSDLEEGLRFYIRAAELGHAIAQYNAGVMLLNGVGSDADIGKATQFLTYASGQGVVKADAVLMDLRRNVGQPRRAG